MAQPDTDGCQLGDLEATPAHSTENRIDSAHVLGIGGSNVDEPAAALVGDVSPAVATSERMRLQASQLADYLRSRQQDIDRREARVNAHTAELESDARAARIWLNQREEELQQREAELKERLERLASAEAAMERNASLKASATSPGLSERESRIERAARALALKQKELVDAEKLLEADRHQVVLLREAVVKNRDRAEKELDAERQRVAEEERRQLAKLNRIRHALERQSELVDRSRASLEQQRSELRTMHREALEIRLATGELWVQLSKAAPSEKLTRSLCEIRARLAEQYRLSRAEAEKKMEELQALRRELSDQQSRLVEQKREWDRWIARRDAEIQQQQQHLLAREKDLERERAAVEERAFQWASERAGYRREIYRLRAQLDQAGAGAAQKTCPKPTSTDSASGYTENHDAVLPRKDLMRSA